jgi:hypothetical protein
MRNYDEIQRDLAGVDANAAATERLDQALTICAFASGLPG